jgi:hypothetical protein
MAKTSRDQVYQVLNKYNTITANIKPFFGFPGLVKLKALRGAKKTLKKKKSGATP